jgi:hypothetical protein
MKPKPVPAWRQKQRDFNRAYVESMKRHGVYIESPMARYQRLRREKKATNDNS